ncbi:hypothetical protein ABTY63_14895 [Streptomyces solisilvae]|uniref:hypothetical protein n=1 Tax=Streptomyces malaysiensis TaxID=92644 RepID=UPI003329A8CB
MAIPQRIEVIRAGTRARVLVDGQELPFALAREKVTVSVHPDEMPTVHLVLMARRVDVVNSVAGDEKREEGE